MKVWSSPSLLALCSLSTVGAFTPRPVTRVGGAPDAARIRALSSSTRRATTAPLAASTLASPESSAAMATGTIVADFGGLIAVQLQEDDDTQAGDLLGKQVVMANQGQALVVAHRPPLVFCYQEDGEAKGSSDDGKAQVLSKAATVSTRNARRVNACGRDVEDSTTDSASLVSGRPIFSPIPQIKDIALINTPLLTGLTMVDALSPIGRGQNMLWITHDAPSVRPYLRDFCASTTQPIIYAALDTDEASLAALPDHVQVVQRTTASTDPVVRAAEGVAMAGTACALAEQLALEEGQHTVVIIDTMDGHKVLWDATTRVLVDVFGVDAVVASDRTGGASSEMRGFYSALIQRSAQYKVKRGGGSVTLLLVTTVPPVALADRVFAVTDFVDAPAKVQERIQWLVDKGVPLTEANLRKIQLPIPSDTEGQRRWALQHVDDLISMSDGQVWMDEDLQKAKQFPPMDPQRSVTRVGIGADTPSRADAPALSKVAEGLRLVLSQAKDHMEGLVTATAANTKERLRQHSFLLVLHQEPGSGARRLSESSALLLAVSQGLLDEKVKDEAVRAGTDEGETTVQNLLEHLRTNVATVMQEIDESLDLTDDNRKLLLESMKAHLDSA